MSHSFAKGQPVRELRQSFAAVKVRADGKKRLIIEPGIHVLASGTKLVPFPGGVELRCGEEVADTGRLWITLETIDPYHAVIDPIVQGVLI